MSTEFPSPDLAKASRFVAASGFVVATRRAAAIWIVMRLTPWATMSCSSRAMRACSCRTASAVLSVCSRASRTACCSSDATRERSCTP